MYKNWLEICNEPDIHLRLLVGMTSNADTLRGLEKGFSHLFTETEQSEPCIPYSVLSGICKDECAKDEEANLIDSLGSVNLPNFVLGIEAGDGTPIPQEWLDSYYTDPGQALLDGVRPKVVIYKGEECAIVEYRSDFFYMVLVPTRYLDLES